MLQSEERIRRIINRNEYSSNCGTDMTICIGAICDNNRAVVLASDRMITSNYPLIEFEHSKSKTTEISDTCIALTAGDALVNAELFRKVKATTSSFAQPAVSGITDTIKNTFIEQRLQKANEKFCKPRGLDIGNLYKNPQLMNTELFLRLDNMVEKHRLGLEVLVCGVDKSGAHIYYLTDPGISECYDNLGYCAIGSGMIHSVQNFIFRNLSPTSSLNETIYTVFEGKRQAENAPGVGQKTDMIVITSDGIKHFTDTDMGELDKLHSQIKEHEKEKWASEKENVISKLSISQKGGE
jgi:20S proteasome alpha/beta subunit